MDDPHADELPGLERLAESEFAEDEEDSASEGSAASLPLLDEAELDGEILIEAPPEENEKPRKKKKAKTVDPAALAAHRVWKRLRAERKAAKKAKRREEAKARKRRGYGADLEGFLVKTQERLEQRAAEAEAAALLMAQTAQTSAPVARATGSDLRSFILKTRERLAEQAAVAKAAQRAKEAKAAALAASVDLDTFRKECQARIAQKLLSKIPQVRTGQVTGSEESLFQRRKIAIVGAGPAGLWAAMLLAQKYRWTDPSGMLRPRPDAPEIVVMEARSMANHCTRTDIRIALSSSTRSMLDQQTRSRSFTSGMPVAEIEDTFLRRWKKVAGHEARISYETPIQDPKELKSYDLILWGAGRRSLDEALRKELGCEVKIGDSQKVIVFQVLELPGDAWQLGSLDLSGATVSQGGRPLRVMLRPGFEGACACWLWVFGLPADLLSSLTPKQASTVPRDSLIEAFEDLVGDSGMALGPSLEALQQRIKGTGITARFVDASFWSSDCAVCQVPLEPPVPLVLIGDALAGKPFYTGSTLNRHLWDVAQLIEEVEFAYDGGPIDVARFGSYEKRYQECVRRIGEFQRKARMPWPSMPALREGREGPPERRQEADSSPLMKSIILPALARVASSGSPLRV